MKNSGSGVVSIYTTRLLTMCLIPSLMNLTTVWFTATHSSKFIFFSSCPCYSIVDVMSFLSLECVFIFCNLYSMPSVAVSLSFLFLFSFQMTSWQLLGFNGFLQIMILVPIVWCAVFSVWYLDFMSFFPLECVFRFYLSWNLCSLGLQVSLMHVQKKPWC